MRSKRFLALVLAIGVLAAACGSDSSSSGGDGDASSEDATGSSETAASSDDADADAPSDGASSLTLDGEEIALDSRGCYAETQEVAGSIITLSSQASGTNAAGESVIVDFTRYAPGGTVGETDDVTIDIGAIGESTSYLATLPFESVQIVDGALSIDDTPFRSFEGGDDVVVSIKLAC